ncbi:MAG: trypsin-like peptidase domain-containing protein, partial [Muribaculaceae bacterium]|nr:trypsin-like peptidase domain-containing protein [Muribaculaceae bacterium]
MNKSIINTLCASMVVAIAASVSCANTSGNQAPQASSTDSRVRVSVPAVDFTNAAESTVNGVVSVKSYNTVNNNTRQRIPQGFDDPFLEFFFGPQYRRQQPQAEPQQPSERQSGLGSGVILSDDGYIVTNNHVIDGASRLEITLNDNRTFDATVVGTDPATDIALVKIEADNLHVIPMGDSDDLRMGEWVLAVGNPFGLTSTVTAGIVSAKARNISNLTQGQGSRGIESFIQTDAAVNPGNSGGALVNLDGQLVGINTAIFSQTGNYSGASFAIPTSIVQKVVNDIKEFGTV